MVEDQRSQILTTVIMGKEMVGTEVVLGNAEFSLKNLHHFEYYTTQHKLYPTGTIQIFVRYLSLNRLRHLPPEIANNENFFFDRYGFQVPTKELQELSYTIESSYQSEPPSLTTGVHKAAKLGIPFPYKARYWQIFVMKHLKLKSTPFAIGLYDELNKKQFNPVLTKQIDKDLPRTFPKHPVFCTKDGRASLRRILQAFSVKHPNIGYTQAMNFIAGYMLLLMEEELAFKLLTVLVEYLIPGYYANTMADLQADQLALRMLVEEYLPKLHKHMEYLGMELNVISTKWFMCLFIHTLPFSSVLRVWDILFCKGTSALILAALALLKLKEEEIISRNDFGHSTEYLESMCLGMYDWKQIIDVMYNQLPSFKIVKEKQKQAKEQTKSLIVSFQFKELESTKFSQQELQSLYDQFETEATNGSLNRDAFFKLIKESEYTKLVSDEIIQERVFLLFDKNGDGTVDFRDYCQVLSILKKGSPKDKLTFFFNLFDSDKDRFICREELVDLLHWQYRSMGGFKQVDNMIEVSVDVAFSNFDKDKDGKLSFEEFENVCKKQPLLVQMLQLVGDD
eukprot:TRINITY_DN6336_c0_g1_i1.p1 TRINITY_DN6336_c0_g1~~TRINITY_DN6336_c0_g1_i1.p1  ORF type:complete len:565 (+),score=121.48 TRINITY_DN6336_c0_g1_i1:433-2127(+)